MSDGPGSADDPVIVVSGLPRSGTSLLMQVLLAGGIPVLADGLRAADTSNPRGYFEYEKVKRLAADNSWLGEARGRALKVIAPLLPFLPSGPRYRVLFLQRDMGEVLRSQSAMLRALGQSPGGDDAALAAAFEAQLATAREFLGRQPLTAVETVDHRDLLAEPGTVIDRIVRFLERPDLDREAMIGAIDPQLYRSRTAGFDPIPR
ncbi:MAG: sulfotransferase family protein [Isosphaeraceae bacterium]